LGRKNQGTSSNGQRCDENITLNDTVCLTEIHEKYPTLNVFCLINTQRLYINRQKQRINFILLNSRTKKIGLKNKYPTKCKRNV